METLERTRLYPTRARLAPSLGPACVGVTAIAAGAVELLTATPFAVVDPLCNAETFIIKPDLKKDSAPLCVPESVRGLRGE
jgi:hypothetical protein